MLLAILFGRPFLRPVQFRRTVFALVCALGWLSGALHESLEAAQWMPDHQHHSPAHHEHQSDDTPADHYPEAEFDHAPLWARDGARITVAPLIGLLFGLLLAFTLLRPVSLRPASVSAAPPSGDPPLRVIWQFVQRCAAASTAPPALN